MFNEADNAAACYADISAAMAEAGLACELIFVDDGSTDGTVAALLEAAGDDARTVVVELRRNFGQAAAMAAGFETARGEVVVALDGDLQNDPRDIPLLLEHLSGFDVVSGWRRGRRDRLARRIPSWIANRLISAITGVKLHDYGCSLKAYRREVLQDIRLYGEMHRFIPALIHWVGGRVTEVEVRHRPRTAGRSKYGLGRTFRVLLDLVTVKFMLKYFTNPLYFFGTVGLWTLLCGIGILGIVVAKKLARGFDMTGNPLLYLSVMLGAMGVQFVMMGLIMEVLTRTYYESQRRTPHRIRTVHREGAEDGDAGKPGA
ncbi:MAG: glycosyltransferase family 2 protein [Candidatus Brocadiaceae bacterium]|nr:glycosyltransferase family 2 protein [Candidatus Brocadiaceae bacterium]